MKPLLSLSVILFCAPIARAQAATAPASSSQFARIDPVALNTLARMSWKYQHLLGYETYIDVKRSDEPQAISVVRRLRVDRGAFVWSELTPDKHWRKWIYGVPYTSIAYDSRFPKRYVRRELTYSGPGDMERVRSVLNGWNINGYLLLPVLSGEWPAQLLVHPALRALSLSRENGLDVVTLSFDAIFPYPDSVAYSWQGNTTLRFAIEPETLLLARIERSEMAKSQTVTTTESYPKARFDPEFDHSIFNSAAPLSYKLMREFPTYRR